MTEPTAAEVFYKLPTDVKLGGEWPPCVHCKKPVYDIEQVVCSGLTFHRGCFFCGNCKKPIDLKEAEPEQKTKDIYCKKCYTEKFSPKHRAFGGSGLPAKEGAPKPELVKSAVPREQIKAKGWACEGCAFFNDGNRDTCEICQKSRPSAAPAQAKREICRKCGTLTAAKFCPECGTKML